MNDIKDKIIEVFKRPFCHYFSDLTKYINVKKEVIYENLEELIKEERVYKKNEFYYLMKKGTMIVNKNSAFISVEDEDDYYCNINDIKGAYTGDEVSFYVLPKTGRDKHDTAVVIEILKHSNEFIYGLLVCKKSKKGTQYYVASYDKTFDTKAYIDEADLNGAVVGSLVTAKILEYGARNKAVITKVIGHKDDPGADISIIAEQYGFLREFDDDVKLELKKIPGSINKEDYKERRDFTSDLVITIDGDTSKDFDDAVSLKTLANGNYELSVHIADVAEYVKDGSALDLEAFKRGTSVYLADRVIPMLPHQLSNGICSLNEGEYRLTLSCIMEIDRSGNVKNYEICEGIIKSAHRMTYNNVNKMLKGDKEVIDTYTDIYPMLLEMEELSKIIREKRMKAGALDFDVPEVEIELNEQGEASKFYLRQRDSAELLIEDFMLMANQTVAYHMNISKLPCVYRVHESPDQSKLEGVFAFIKNLGYKIPSIKNDIKPKMIQTLMNNIASSSEAFVINQIILRSMMKAKYSEECLGHYGLAFKYYCHFTSPIRRYPDLMVHRLIKELLLHPGDDFFDKYKNFMLNIHDVAFTSSVQERKSVDCERDVNDMLMAGYMAHHIGEVYEGIINSITSFGMFITLPEGIEGLVHINNMDGYFIYNEKKMTLSSYSKTYHIGDKVEIVVLSSSKKERSVDFVLKEDYHGSYSRK